MGAEDAKLVVFDAAVDDKDSRGGLRGGMGAGDVTDGFGGNFCDEVAEVWVDEGGEGSLEGGDDKTGEKGTRLTNEHCEMTGVYAGDSGNFLEGEPFG